MFRSAGIGAGVGALKSTPCLFSLFFKPFVLENKTRKAKKQTTVLFEITHSTTPASFTELVSEPRQFCEAQRGNFRAAIGASRHVEEILLDGDLRGKEGELPPIGANSNTIAARCCQQYPKETGAELEHLKQPAFIAVKMSYRTTGSTPTLA